MSDLQCVFRSLRQGTISSSSASQLAARLMGWQHAILIQFSGRQTFMRRFPGTALALVATATLSAGCADHTPSAPSRPVGIAAASADRQTEATFNPELQQALATLRAATA